MHHNNIRKIIKNKLKTRYKMILSKIKEKIPKKFRRYINKKFKFFNLRFQTEIWCLDSVEVNDDYVEIKGWALPPKRNYNAYAFSINNEEFDNVIYPTVREDIGKLFWYIPHALNSGFECKKYTKNRNFFPNGYASFSFVNKKINIPTRNEKTYYFNMAADKKLSVPDEKRRQRVHGNESEKGFLIEGFSTFMKLKWAIKKILNRDFTDFSNILDWGCGCGRLTRYFNDIKEVSINGVDIDNDNIEWCQKHLPFGNFTLISEHTPTPFPNNSFDLIIGISIFTHLSEKTQFEWLKELHRIAKNDSILLMTVHGEEAVKRAVLTIGYLMPLKVKGFLDIGHNPSLDGIIRDDNYYRNIYHKKRYIQKKWAKYFQIIDIIPGCIGNLQDLVIMKKIKN
jgi:hypothetical protein